MPATLERTQIPPGTRCERCSMDASVARQDESGRVHYFCAHHASATDEHELPASAAITEHHEPQARDYLILVAIIGAILAATFVSEWLFGHGHVTDMMRVFMALFFITFATFKLLNLKGFADSYVNYDLIAKRVRAYAFVYPLLELGLGLAYLFKLNPLTVNALTFVIMSVGSVGILRELIRGSKIKCACLGTFVNLPLTTVSLIEDISMAIMAGFTLLAIVTGSKI